jgi:hypothetical protein
MKAMQHHTRVAELTVDHRAQAPQYVGMKIDRLQDVVTNHACAHVVVAVAARLVEAE